MPSFRIIKRATDIAVASLLLIALSPILLCVALLILLFEGRPVFYTSRRCTGLAKNITTYKFRTMAKDARSEKYDLHRRFMRDGYLDIPLSCEVFTPIGRFLERTQIVEVPQFFNVIAGQMSLIGNRPLPPENVELLKAHDNWQKRFDSPAGISGIAQIVGKLNLQPCERLAFENAYSGVYRNGNVLKCDLMILLYTLRTIMFSSSLSHTNAHRLLRSSMGPPRNPAPALELNGQETPY